MPSGIVTTSPSIIQLVFDEMPSIGVITTKSVGPIPREGNREPVMTQYAPGCYMNAVGLTNPGAEVAAQQLSELKVPDHRFLLTSIFGGSVEEIVEVAKILAPYSDGLELNLSCPHAKGYGMDMGQDAELVRQIVHAVKQAVDIPVVPKLTPNVPNIKDIALAAVEGGADAICAINAVGPGYFTAHGHPVLSNTYGGMSGKGILPIGLKCVKQIREVTDLPIIGCGGISSMQDIKAYEEAGASIFGIGSALTGLSTIEIKNYFEDITLSWQSDAADPCVTHHNTHVVANSHDPVRNDLSMAYTKFRLVKNTRIAEDIALLTFDRKIDIKAGEFIFTWIPGLGEKPFSILNDDPFSLVVIEQGIFTKKFIRLEAGEDVFIRGPYGIAVSPPPGSKIIAVSGGTGLAAVYQIARDFGNSEIFIGARSKDRLYFMDECQQVANLHVSTDDGSMGDKGLVTESLQNYLAALDTQALKDLIFYNCGPAPMVIAAEKVEQQFVGNQQIYSAIDYLTKCGVGVCGACSAPDGRRLCVDGPFLRL